jgi:class 3 adenylate cyclase
MVEKVSGGRAARTSVSSKLAARVNVAARMLDKSEPGTVAVTEGIWDQISAQFEAEDLGPLDIKGKGMISVFGIRPKHHRAPVHVGDGT